MAKFLSKLFKPKWQSANIETRKQALTNLDSNEADDLAILLQLASDDPSMEVQQAAINQIKDTQALIKLHKNAKDPLRSILENRLYALASEQSLSIFDLIIDVDILSDMIIKATQAESFICGLARVEDSSALLKIAMQARNAQIRQAAAELIESENELNLLFAHAKNKDKTVYQVAKSKLTRLKSLAQEQEANHQKIEKLLKDMENLSQTEALQHFEARLEHVLKQWPAVSASASMEESKRFETLSAECEQKRQSLNEQEAETQAASEITPEEQTNQAEEASQPQDSELQSTLNTLHETLNRFHSQSARIQDIAALDALVKTQENRWIEASEQEQVSMAMTKAYQNAMTQLRHYLRSLHALKDHAEDITRLSQELSQGLNAPEQEASQISALLSSRKSLSQAIAKVDWPAHFSKPEDVTRAEQLMADSGKLKQQQTEQLKQLDRQIEQGLKALDQTLEEKQIKLANKQLKALQALLKPLPGNLSQKYQPALSLRVNQLNELHDWKGFANTPKQLELCDAMERLADMHIDPNDKAEKIKAMQQEWKALGGSADKALWERFKSAADKAFEPCALYFAEQQQLKEANLKKRETLIEQLQTYLDSIDWASVSSQAANPIWASSDWKTADKINRQARQEWKDSFPVDFRAGKSAQQRFNQLIEEFDQHLVNEKTFNLGRKQAIVDQARSLLDETDIQQAIQQVKQLQEAWQKVGITPHKADRKLWTEYRQICDEIFARREQMREVHRSEINQAISSAEQICSDIEASLSKLDSQTDEELKSLATAHRKSLQTLPKLPSGVLEKISKRIESVLSAIDQEISLREQQRRSLIWQEARRKASLIRTVYADVSATNEGLPEEKKQELQARLQSQQDLPEALQASMDALWHAVSENRLDDIELIDEDQARALCIACEIAAGIDSPEEDKALRMKLQVSRLSEGLGGSSDSSNPMEQLENTLARWYLSLGLGPSAEQTFDKRIQRATEALLSN